MFFKDNIDLIDWQNYAKNKLEPWKPHSLEHNEWPPNYKGLYAWRIAQLKILRNDPVLLASAKAYYAEKPAEFIMHWIDTYDPRKANDKWVPFVFFKKQAGFIDFVNDCQENGESGLVEKCRDAGVTWGACAWSVHAFLFKDGFAIGWGSRKQELVDKLGEPDSIFEKMRLILRRLPDIWLPNSYEANFMRLVNNENGSVISGEAGDNIGRGGRKSIYFKDESAHYERPEKIEAALGDNTNTQIDISSVNGLGNPFHRRREAGIEWQPGKEMEKGYTQVYVIDWRDHPEKTQQWYNNRKAKYEREGLLHIFAQEVDRNYSAAIQNTIIPYEWITSAVDAHKKFVRADGRIGFTDDEIPNVWNGGLDVADEGNDRNAFVKRQWIIWRYAEEWGERDPGVTSRRAIAGCRDHNKITVQYDSIGIGSNVKSEFNRLVDEKVIDPRKIEFIPWNAGGSVLRPFDRVIPDDKESMLNKDAFANIKAQAWLSIRSRFYKTFKNVTEGFIYPPDEMISLDSNLPLLHQVMKELAQPTQGKNGALKTMVEKKPDGMASPNLADGGIMMYFPCDSGQNFAITGEYGA